MGDATAHNKMGLQVVRRHSEANHRGLGVQGGGLAGGYASDEHDRHCDCDSGVEGCAAVLRRHLLLAALRLSCTHALDLRHQATQQQVQEAVISLCDLYLHCQCDRACVVVQLQ